MITLENYIFENQRTTGTNVERKAELEKWLKHKQYPEYVELLNKMLDDPKAKTLLSDGFGGELGDTKFIFSVKDITVSSLRPTQNEIDVDKSLKHGLTRPESVHDCFKDPVVINNSPLITFRGNYVIDGHHRWSEVIILNPDAKITCFDYDADISPIQMLKAVQGTIAAVMADDNKNNGKVPVNKVEGQNLFDKEWTEKRITEYINSLITDDCVEEISKQIGDKMNKQEVIDYIVDNVMSLKANNYPEDNAPERGLMPQTNKAGTDANDKSTRGVDSPGSALNKMKTGKFDKDAVK